MERYGKNKNPVLAKAMPRKRAVSDASARPDDVGDKNAAVAPTAGKRTEDAGGTDVMAKIGVYYV